MIDLTRPELVATSNASERSLLLGNFIWKIENDEQCSHGVTEQMLSLSHCNNNEYICDNGLCIDLEKRCDGVMDCLDSSDEFRCRMVDVDQSYSKFMAPIILSNSNFKESFEKVKVYMSIEILSLKL